MQIKAIISFVIRPVLSDMPISYRIDVSTNICGVPNIFSGQSQDALPTFQKFLILQINGHTTNGILGYGPYVLRSVQRLAPLPYRRERRALFLLRRSDTTQLRWHNRPDFLSRGERGTLRARGIADGARKRE